MTAEVSESTADSDRGSAFDLSVVVPTLDRTGPLSRLLESLGNQEGVRFEVIIVDQNPTPLLEAVLKAAETPYPLRHLRTPEIRGASRARNHGLAEASGAAVLFPDDDSWYPPGTLLRGLDLLNSQHVDAVFGRPTDTAGRTINGRFEASRVLVDRSNVFTTHIEWMAFFRTTSIRSVGGYNPKIGVGAPTPWQSCEAQDLSLRLLSQGQSLLYDPDLIGHHDRLDTENPDRSMRRRARRYGRGHGFVLGRHRFGPNRALYWVIRPIGGMLRGVARLNIDQVRYYGSVAAGRIEGYIGGRYSKIRPDELDQ